MTGHCRVSVFQEAEENNFSEKDVFSVSTDGSPFHGQRDKTPLFILCTTNSGPTWLLLLHSLCTTTLNVLGGNPTPSSPIRSLPEWHQQPFGHWDLGSLRMYVSLFCRMKMELPTRSSVLKGLILALFPLLVSQR